MVCVCATPAALRVIEHEAPLPELSEDPAAAAAPQPAPQPAQAPAAQPAAAAAPLPVMFDPTAGGGGGGGGGGDGGGNPMAVGAETVHDELRRTKGVLKGGWLEKKGGGAFLYFLNLLLVLLLLLLLLDCPSPPRGVPNDTHNQRPSYLVGTAVTKVTPDGEIIKERNFAKGGRRNWSRRSD